MQAALSDCIATTQRILADLGGPLVSSCSPDARAYAVLAHVAASGVPEIDDSRVPSALNSKLHRLTEEYFSKACMALRDTHSHLDVRTMEASAWRLRTTYIHLYERQILRAAAVQRKAAPKEKQPFANDILLYAFDRSQTPTKREREVLASLTGMTVEQVRVWFQNRRSRHKKKAPELQQRRPLQLDDVLERVREACKASDSTARTRIEEYDDDNDSGYWSGSDRGQYHPPTWQLPCARKCEALSVHTSTTSRSFPSAYIPQTLPSHAHFDLPTWRRAPAVRPPVPPSTVTVDELARSMARLSLRQRRQPPSDCTISSCSAVNAASPVPVPNAIPSKTARTTSRRIADTGRKVAGGKRAAIAGISPAAQAAPTTSLPAILAEHSAVPTKARKKPGPPRRKPAGKALARHASDASLASTSSTSSGSSRSTSYASDFSVTSAASDFSMTSVESSSMAPSAKCLQSQSSPHATSFGVRDLFASFPHAPCGAEVPVYDLSTSDRDFAAVSSSTSDVAALFTGSELAHPLQTPVAAGSASGHSHIVDQPQCFDIGLGDMNVLLDFSGSSYPSLEALLAVETSAFCDGLLHSEDAVFRPTFQKRDPHWHDMASLLSSQG